MRSFSRETWLTPPHNRSSFQQVQSLFPTVRLRRGGAPETPFTTDPVEIDHIRFGGESGEKYSIQEFLANSYTDALLIVRNGVLIHEHYDNGMQADSLHLLNSISKTFLGMLAGRLVGEGVVDPEARVAAYVPHLAGTAFDQTTVRQALDMTGAVKSGEDYANRSDDFWVETAVLGWRPDLAAKAGTTSLKAFAVSRIETERGDGQGFHYRTLLTNIVAMVLEGAAQTPVNELMEAQLWQKLRPESDANVVVDAEGFPYFGAGMSASARDLARFGQLLLNDGAVDGEQVVPADWVRSTRDGSDDRRAHFAATDYALMFNRGHYQNQTWASTADGVLICIGIYGQTIYVHQPSRMVIVKLSTHPEPANDRLFAHTFMAMRALAKGLAR
ncbi:MAG: serine hydrolase [Pseudomonadota bacterium]